MKNQIKNHTIVLVLTINVFLNIFIYNLLLITNVSGQIHPFLLISSSLNEMQNIFLSLFLRVAKLSYQVTESYYSS